MALVIPLEQLSQQMIRRIADDLFIIPVKKVNNRFVNNEGGSIAFFQVKEKMLYLPYHYGGNLFKIRPNQNLNHAQVQFVFNKELYPYQIEVANECLQQCQQTGSTTMGLYPGFGKTVVSVWLASKLSYLTLVLYNRTSLATQWQNSFADFSDAVTWTVGKPYPSNPFNVILCMDKSFHKIPAEIVSLIGTVIIDEAHMFCTPTAVPILLGTQPRYVLTCTATMQREDKMERIMYKLVGEHAVNRKNDKVFNVYRVLTGIKGKTEKQSDGRLNYGVLINSLSYNRERNNLIMHFVQQLMTNKKILVLVKYKEHCSIIYQLALKITKNVATMYGQQRSYADSNILIGTYDKLGTGFDEASFCADYGGHRIDTVILGTTFKAMGNLEQFIGRAMRSEMPTVIDLVDSHHVPQKHWRIRAGWYHKHNTNIYHMRVKWGNIKESFMIPGNMYHPAEIINIRYFTVENYQPNQRKNKAKIKNTLVQQDYAATNGQNANKLQNMLQQRYGDAATESTELLDI